MWSRTVDRNLLMADLVNIRLLIQLTGLRRKILRSGYFVFPLQNKNIY